MIERITRSKQIINIEMNSYDLNMARQRIIIYVNVAGGMPETLIYKSYVTLNIEQAQQLQHELQKSIEYYEKKQTNSYE